MSRAGRPARPVAPAVADAHALLRERHRRAEERALAAGPEAYAAWQARQDEPGDDPAGGDS